MEARKYFQFRQENIALNWLELDRGCLRVLIKDSEVFGQIFEISVQITVYFNTRIVICTVKLLFRAVMEFAQLCAKKQYTAQI